MANKTFQELTGVCDQGAPAFREGESRGWSQICPPPAGWRESGFLPKLERASRKTSPNGEKNKPNMEILAITSKEQAGTTKLPKYKEGYFKLNK